MDGDKKHGVETFFLTMRYSIQTNYVNCKTIFSIIIGEQND